MRQISALLFLSFLQFLILVSSASAEKQKRYALLIGNKNYAITNLSLKNPHNDVEQLGKTLRKLGFAVTIVKDGDFGSIQKAVKRHTSKLNAAGSNAIGFFYYSGHGAMNEQTRINYLIPVDISSVSTKTLWDDSIRLQEILNEMRERAPNATHFVIFDACRNVLRVSTPGSKSLLQSKGFAPEQNIPGMLIAYSTEEGAIASDVGKGTGPYAKALSEELIKPGREVVAVFRAVQLRLKKEINQQPWLTYGSLPAYYLAGRPDKLTTTDKTTQAPIDKSRCSPDEQALWNRVTSSNKKFDYEYYLKIFPKGCHALVAEYEVRKRVASLQKQPKPDQKNTPAYEDLNKSNQKQLARSMQRELARVGCYRGAFDGLWGRNSRRALARFNSYSGLKLNTRSPSQTAIQTLKRRRSKVCTQGQNETDKRRTKLTTPTKPEKPKSSGKSYDGVWRIVRTAPGCRTQRTDRNYYISNGRISPGSGYVRPNGRLYIKIVKGDRVGVLTGWIRGRSGSGGFTGTSPRGNCSGSFTMRKVSG